LTTGSGRYLLDSQVLLLWWFDPGRLSREVRLVLINPTSKVFMSAASIWKLSLKHHQGKLRNWAL